MISGIDKKFFEPIVSKAIELIDPHRIILFGSFARGDFKSKSDIDIAFKFSAPRGSWLLFKSWVDESFSSLREIDLINLDEADEVIKKSIMDEGVILYEREN